jgi:hypothetical protein
LGDQHKQANSVMNFQGMDRRGVLYFANNDLAPFVRDQHVALHSPCWPEFIGCGIIFQPFSTGLPEVR